MDRDGGVLAFDVNVTRLDLRPLDSLLDDLLGDAALDRLRDAGRRMAALSNSPLGISAAQLRHADIADRIDAIVARPGMPLDPLGEQPGVVGADPGEIAPQLLAA